MILQSDAILENSIILLLSRQFNLSASDIQKKIHHTGKQYSLQGIYKGLQKLQISGIVIKEKQFYSLRLPWVMDFIALADVMAETYIESGATFFSLPERGERMIWRFKNVLRMNEFWSHILLILVQKSADKTLFGWNPHLWFHFAQTAQEEQYIKALKLAHSKLYLIIGGDTYLDRWAEKYLKIGNVEYVYGNDHLEKDQSKYINIIDDYVLTIKLDEKSAQLVNALYDNTTSLEGANLQDLLQIFHMKANIKFWLENNPSKALQYRKKFSRFFGIKEIKTHKRAA